MTQPHGLETDDEAKSGAAQDADLLAEFLSRHNVPCPRCGYDVHLLKGHQCPECGDELQLQLGLREPKLAAYLTLLAAGWAGLGGSALFMLVALANAGHSWWSRRPAHILIAFFLTMIPLVALIIWRRRMFRALPVQRQWFIAVLVIALVIAFSFSMIAAFR